MTVTAIHKFSRQRELIYNRVKNYPVHPTADEVYTALKKEHKNLSLGTVYRNLNLLTEMKMLKKIHTDNAKDRFDARTDAHCHFLCERCGRVFDVEDSTLNGIEERILERHGHIVGDTSLNFKGICRECAAVSEPV